MRMTKGLDWGAGEDAVVVVCALLRAIGVSVRLVNARLQVRQCAILLQDIAIQTP